MYVLYKYDDNDNVSEKNSTLPILFPSFFATTP